LEDPPRSQDACSLRNNADAKLLSHIKLAHPDDEQYHIDANSQPLRVFCGIYTMQKNHDTNMRATRDTWAKKCDGFIAFSTHEDPLIPSINILHEGGEKYENMWQKSRSIWKYVYAHLRDDFDFFLLGGDDMFYIVENLRAYLGSHEITSKRAEGNGEFHLFVFVCVVQYRGCGCLCYTTRHTTLISFHHTVLGCTLIVSASLPSLRSLASFLTSTTK